jgi:hypothetical protein
MKNDTPKSHKIKPTSAQQPLKLKTSATYFHNQEVTLVLGKLNPFNHPTLKDEKTEP